MSQYLPLLALAVLAVVFGGVSRLASKLLGPALPTGAKEAPYECGIVPSQEPPQRFPVRFFLVAMIFIVFDIEIVFVFPWATVYDELGGFGLVALGIFVAGVFESFVYLIGNGALDWGPAKVVRVARDRLGVSGAQIDAMRSPTRTAATTVRRVGTDGREATTAGEAA